MKDEDEESDGDPEVRRESAQMVPVSMKGQDVVLVRGSHVHLMHVNSVLQVFHMLLIGRDIKHGGSGFCFLDGEGSEGVDEFDGGIETAGVAGEIVFVTAVERGVDLGFIVLAHVDGNVEVSRVAVRKTAKRHHVAMQVFRLHAELEVIVGELEGSDGEHDGLENAVGARLQHRPASLLLQRQSPKAGQLGH